MKYYIKADWILQSKNRAQKQCELLRQNYECLVVDEKDIKDLTAEIRKRLEQINLGNPRCGDLHLSSWSNSLTGGVFISVGEVFRLSFLPIKNKK